MGVSADNSGLDLNAIVDGGESFIARLAEFQAAAAASKAALDDLKLGKAAKDAFNEAGRVLQEAKNKRDAELAALTNDVTTARAALAGWEKEQRAALSAEIDRIRAALV